MFLASMAEMWVSIADGIAYGWDWLMTNGGEILKYIMYVVTSGGVGTAVIYIIKVISPMLKNSNKPVLKELKVALDKITILAEQQEISNNEIKILRDENKTFKEYFLLASEANSRNIMLTEEMKAKFGYLVDGLKNTENEVAKKIAENIEESIVDNTLSKEEIVKIAEDIPIVQDVLGMSLKDIELELKGE